jgi:hypothetical protein
MSNLDARRVPRELQSLNYIDPERMLIELRQIELAYPLHTLRYKSSSLRSHPLKKFGEGRQAALFCYGMSRVLGWPVHFAQAERMDFDIVARCVADNEISYVPVQLKEWVPDTVNPQASLQTEIDKLGNMLTRRI